MIPFDIKFRPQIESGEYKVETANGYPVTIYRWDFKDSYDTPIMGSYVCEDGAEYCASWTNKGLYSVFGEQGDYDLFIITPEPEPELTEFENACLQLYQEGCNDGLAGDRLSNEALKVESAELLELAEKTLSVKYKFFSDMNGFAYGTGYEAGKKEALKDLPRWKKVAVDMGNGISAESNIVPRLYDSEELCFCYEGNYLLLSELEKLPGFKEDEQ